jgi:very-short-patch-repair endonuclease
VLPCVRFGSAKRALADLFIVDFVAPAQKLIVEVDGSGAASGRLAETVNTL